MGIKEVDTIGNKEIAKRINTGKTHTFLKHTVTKAEVQYWKEKTDTVTKAEVQYWKEKTDWTPGHRSE